MYGANILTASSDGQALAWKRPEAKCKLEKVKNKL
jgi:hypothetical protein